MKSLQIGSRVKHVRMPEYCGVVIAAHGDALVSGKEVTLYEVHWAPNGEIGVPYAWKDEMNFKREGYLPSDLKVMEQ